MPPAWGSRTSQNSPPTSPTGRISRVYGAVRSRFVAGDAFASTLLVVSGFTRPEFKVEVEIVAVR